MSSKCGTGDYCGRTTSPFNYGGALGERMEDVVTATDITFQKMDGTAGSLADYAGDVVLVVNVASKCGLTPQYEGLQRLYEHKKEYGFTVLAFPANNFAGQEPGTDPEIAEFCSTSYSVTFPVMSKTAWWGKTSTPYTRPSRRPSLRPRGRQSSVRASAGHGITPTDDPDALWNFEKFLIGRDGAVVARFAASRYTRRPPARRCHRDSCPPGGPTKPLNSHLRAVTSATPGRPFRSSGTFGFAFSTGKLGWAESSAVPIRDGALDFVLARRAGEVRPATVPLFGAIRHAELAQLFLQWRKPEAMRAALQTLRSLVTALTTTTLLLHREEVNWLYRVFEADALEVNGPAEEGEVPDRPSGWVQAVLLREREEIPCGSADQRQDEGRYEPCPRRLPGSGRLVDWFAYRPAVVRLFLCPRLAMDGDEGAEGKGRRDPATDPDKPTR